MEGLYSRNTPRILATVTSFFDVFPAIPAGAAVVIDCLERARWRVSMIFDIVVK